MDAVHGRHVNEAGLVVPRDDADFDADATPDLGDEIAAVFRLAYGRRGRCHNLVDLMGIGEPPEFRQRLECRGHGGGC